MADRYSPCMAKATADIAQELGDRECVTVERDGDLITGFNEDPNVITVVQIDILEDCDPDMVRLRGFAAETLLHMLHRLVDPDEQLYRRVGRPMISIDLPLSGDQ